MTRGSAPVGGIYGWVATHPRAVDALLASAVLFFCGSPYLLAVIGGLTNTRVGVLHDLGLLALDLALIIPLYWRRSHPVRAAAVMLLICLIQLTFQIEIVAGQISVLIIISAMAGYASRRASWTGLGLGLAGILVLGIQTTGFANLPAGSIENPIVPVAIFTVTGWSFVGVAWLIGDLTRSRRLEKAALADRADRLRHERERELTLAAADERAHIAREMHDIVAHSLAIIVTQADGARYAAPPQAGPVVPALEAIAETARTSLADMRRLLGVLRTDDGAPTAPAPGVSNIPALVDSVRASGLGVGFTVAGNARPLAPGAELVLFRVVQESLTNVIKHAGPGARARVLIDWMEDAVEVTVTDTGQGLRGEPDNGGHGLQGMRERLALYDGRLTVSGGQDGGVIIHAHLPYSSAVTGD